MHSSQMIWIRSICNMAEHTVSNEFWFTTKTHVPADIPQTKGLKTCTFYFLRHFSFSHRNAGKCSLCCLAAKRVWKPLLIISWKTITKMCVTTDHVTLCWQETRLAKNKSRTSSEYPAKIESQNKRTSTGNHSWPHEQHTCISCFGDFLFSLAL
jgi:hypothetical protein